jgi:hypothetical protein
MSNVDESSRWYHNGDRHDPKMWEERPHRDQDPCWACPCADDVHNRTCRCTCHSHGNWS